MSMGEKVAVPDQEQYTYENLAKAKRNLLLGQVDATTFLPVKVVSDGGSPALGKLVCTVD